MGYTKMTLTLFIYDRKAIYYILLAHEKESTIESLSLEEIGHIRFPLRYNIVEC